MIGYAVLCALSVRLKPKLAASFVIPSPAEGNATLGRNSPRDSDSDTATDDRSLNDNLTVCTFLRWFLARPMLADRRVRVSGGSGSPTEPGSANGQGSGGLSRSQQARARPSTSDVLASRRRPRPGS